MSRSHFHLEPLSEQASKALASFMGQTARQRQVRVRKRGNAVYWSARGLTVQEISRDLGVTEQSVWRWLHNFQRLGVTGLLDPPPRGVLTPDQVAEITRLKFPMHQSKRTGKLRVQENKISYRQITAWIKSRWGVALSHERVRQIIRKNLREPDKLREQDIIIVP